MTVRLVRNEPMPPEWSPIGRSCLVFCKPVTTMTWSLPTSSAARFTRSGLQWFRRHRKAAGIPASDILKALDFESLVVSIVASDMREKRAISETDLERLELARKRIAAARSSYGR